MVIERGQVWWADLDDPRGAEPGFRRPLLIVQDDAFNRSRIRTVVAIVLTSNLRLVDAPGNVLIPAIASGLPKDSVVNVSQIVTIDRDFLSEPTGKVGGQLMKSVDAGLRLVLSL
ncbi:MAG TPA: type II toxin-antitoxin system PemK/MazF family toxin [Vicinamibacterales bacterium]|nr:type II toxin-antitoxin system PemK/MazF family toxin [Vicinamibacterales bacterium]